MRKRHQAASRRSRGRGSVNVPVLPSTVLQVNVRPAYGSPVQTSLSTCPTSACLKAVRLFGSHHPAMGWPSCHTSSAGRGVPLCN